MWSNQKSPAFNNVDLKGGIFVIPEGGGRFTICPEYFEKVVGIELYPPIMLDSKILEVEFGKVSRISKQLSGHAVPVRVQGLTVEGLTGDDLWKIVCRKCLRTYFFRRS